MLPACQYHRKSSYTLYTLSINYLTLDNPTIEDVEIHRSVDADICDVLGRDMAASLVTRSLQCHNGASTGRLCAFMQR
jgi:hypothetical protein